MSTMLTTDWLWPFLVAAVGLAAAFSASLVWAGGPRVDVARADGAQAEGAPRGQAPLLMLAAPLALIALYAALGHPRALNPAEREPGSAGQVEAMVQRLSERLQREPSDTAGWLMLARSQKVLGRYEAAAASYERAAEPARRDPDLLADWIEARVLAADRHFDAHSRELLALAMRLAPDHPGVLLMRGLAALDRGDRTAAAKAFTVLRDQHPEGSADREALDGALARLAQGRDPRVAEPAEPAEPGGMDAKGVASAPAPRP